MPKTRLQTPLRPPITGPFELAVELPWATSSAECLDCARTWVATHPADCPSLQCPRCGRSNTLRYRALGSAEPD